MFELLQAIPFSFAALFPVLNPLGSAVLFLALTLGLPEEVLHKLARQIATNTFILLFIVLISGSWILQLFGITIPVVQIAGGLVLAYIAWTMLNQAPANINEGSKAVRTEQDAQHMAFFPLTMPLTAGPGCIAVTLTIGAHEMSNTVTRTVMGQLGAMIGILLGAISVYLCYRYASRVTRSLGASGTQVITRLSAFINLCIGIQIIWHGVAALITPGW